jgi:hypothetical protein
MLPDSKISQLISLQIPGLTYVMWQYRASGPLYEVIHVFADYTRRMIRGGQLSEAKKCFTIAGVLYRNGSRLLRNAIESVYLYGLSPLLDTAFGNRPVKTLLPAVLQQARTEQLHNGTI